MRGRDSKHNILQAARRNPVLNFFLPLVPDQKQLPKRASYPCRYSSQVCICISSDEMHSLWGVLAKAGLLGPKVNTGPKIWDAPLG